MSSVIYSDLTNCIQSIPDREQIQQVSFKPHSVNTSRGNEYTLYRIRGTKDKLSNRASYRQLAVVTITTDKSVYQAQDCFGVRSDSPKHAFRSFLGYNRALLHSLSSTPGESAKKLKNQVLPFISSEKFVSGKGNAVSIELDGKKETVLDLREPLLDDDQTPARDLKYRVVKLSVDPMSISHPTTPKIRKVVDISCGPVISDEGTSQEPAAIEEKLPVVQLLPVSVLASKKDAIHKHTISDACAWTTAAVVIGALAVTVLGVYLVS